MSETATAKPDQDTVRPAHPVTGHALLVDLHQTDQFLPDGIYNFDTEQEAIEFAVAELIKAGEIKRNGTQYVLKKDGGKFESGWQAMCDWADSLGGWDYYHIREVRSVK